MLIQDLPISDIVINVSMDGMENNVPFLRISPLRPPTILENGSATYMQSEEETRIVAEKVELKSEYYLTDLQLEINKLCSENKCTFNNDGNVLCVLIDTQVCISDITFATQTKGLRRLGTPKTRTKQPPSALRVISKFKVEPYITIDNKQFVLTGTIQHNSKHFVSFVNNLNQTWVEMDDDTLKCVTTPQTVPGTTAEGIYSLFKPNTVCYFFEKLPEELCLPAKSNNIPLYVCNENVFHSTVALDWVSTYIYQYLYRQSCLSFRNINMLPFILGKPVSERAFVDFLEANYDWFIQHNIH